MLAEKDCSYWKAKGMHLYVPYYVQETGEEGECCHGCGVTRPSETWVAVACNPAFGNDPDMEES